jgi:SAM-dependent methyltransferase
MRMSKKSGTELLMTKPHSTIFLLPHGFCRSSTASATTTIWPSDLSWRQGLRDATTILDFGCGPGILTTFYARRYPHARVIGIDRSRASIAAAQRKAEALHLENVRFEYGDLDIGFPSATYDCIVATHALVQSEQDPGLPSLSWRTFERAHDPNSQSAFERRTGLGLRLDRLLDVMSASGRMMVFEKTRQLGRRIPLQRAFAARGLRLLEQPQLVRYALVEEVSDDGPFFVLRRGKGNDVAWNEDPEPDEGRPFEGDTRPVGTVGAGPPALRKPLAVRSGGLGAAH